MPGSESREELIRSRARVVAASDETRRRIQRELHSGAQQRLVQAIITLKLAKADPSPELIEEALEQAERAMSDLRELVSGIMPAALTRGGLRSGVETLIGRAALPVEAEIEAGRMPEQLEMTAYFVIAEALAGGGTSVRAGSRDGELVVEVDGVALEGDAPLHLADRVAACDGTLTRAGTTLTVTLPIVPSGNP